MLCAGNSRINTSFDGKPIVDGVTNPDTNDFEKLWASLVHDTTNTCPVDNPNYTPSSGSAAPQWFCPNTNLFSSVAPDPNASQLDKALTDVATAIASGNASMIKDASNRAIELARNLPNGEVLAIPMVEADILALQGDFFGASNKYSQITASLKVAAKQDPNLQTHIDKVQARHKGVLATGAATSVAEFGNATDPITRMQMQQLATQYADQIYLLEPTERNLQLLVATYSRVGLDISELRRKVALNKDEISRLEMEQVNSELHPASRSTKKPAIDFNYFANGNTYDPFGFAALPTPAEKVMELRVFNQQAEFTIDRIDGHILSLINQAHADSPYQINIHSGTANVLLGNRHAALDNLQAARALYKNEKVKHTPENLTTQITVLHRLADASISVADYNLQEEVVSEAQGLINELRDSDYDHATVLTIENMEISARIRNTRMSWPIHGLSDEDRKATEQMRNAAIRQNYLDIVNYCETALEETFDPSAREHIAGRLLHFRASIAEHDFGIALDEHKNEETDAARQLVIEADKEYGAALEKFGYIATPEEVNEITARVEFGKGTFMGLTAESEEDKEAALAILRNIATNYADTSAGRMVVGMGNLNKKHTIAALKTWAGGLTENPGNGLKGCLAGAGIAVVATAPEGVVTLGAVSGGAAIIGCAAGFATDRMIISQPWNRISFAYHTGLTTVSTDQAILSTAIFALSLFSMYVGGAAGGLAQKAVLAGGSKAGSSLTSFLVSRGMTPGPWMRGAGAIALREASYMGNAYVFHKISSGVNHTALRALDIETEAHADNPQDYLVSWLFVRFVPAILKANPAGRMIKGEGRLDQLARAGANGFLGVSAVQGLQALADRNPKHISMDSLATASLNFLAMHYGNRSIEAVLPMESVAKLGKRLDNITIRNMIKARETIENAPPPNNWWDGFGGGFGGLQPAYAVAWGRRGGAAALAGRPNEANPFELPPIGTGFNPVMMSSGLDSTNTGESHESNTRFNKGKKVSDEEPPSEDSGVRRVLARVPAEEKLADRLPYVARRWLEEIGRKLIQISPDQRPQRNSPLAPFYPENNFVVIFDAKTGELVSIQKNAILPKAHELTPGQAAIGVKSVEFGNRAIIKMGAELITPDGIVSDQAMEILKAINGRIPIIPGRNVEVVQDLGDGVQLVTSNDAQVDQQNTQLMTSALSKNMAAMTMMGTGGVDLLKALEIADWVSQKENLPNELVYELLTQQSSGWKECDIGIDGHGQFVGASVHRNLENSPRGTTYEIGTREAAVAMARNLKFMPYIKDGQRHEVPMDFQWEGQKDGPAHDAFMRWYNSPKFVEARKLVITQDQLSARMFKGMDTRKRVGAVLDFISQSQQLIYKIKANYEKGSDSYQRFIEKLEGYRNQQTPLNEAQELDVAYFEMIVNKALGPVPAE
ncbi:MAG: hypothetical protein ABH871_02200 [Pseudomonadota bacterium]